MKARENLSDGLTELADNKLSNNNWASEFLVENGSFF